MAEQLKIYQCKICGNIVEVLHAGAGNLVCCNQDMKLLKENTEEAATEKHIPVIEEVEDGFEVKVGSVAHPMDEKHFIEWIDVEVDGKECRKFLKPGEGPSVTFKKSSRPKSVKAFCNLHGLWKGE